MIDDEILFPDEVDTLVESHKLKEHAKHLSIEDLINYIMDYEQTFNYENSIDEIINNYLSGEEVTQQQIIKLENLYVLMQVSAIGEDGKLYISNMVKK